MAGHVRLRMHQLLTMLMLMVHLMHLMHHLTLLCLALMSFVAVGVVFALYSDVSMELMGQQLKMKLQQQQQLMELLMVLLLLKGKSVERHGHSCHRLVHFHSHCELHGLH